MAQTTSTPVEILLDQCFMAPLIDREIIWAEISDELTAREQDSEWWPAPNQDNAKRVKCEP